MMQETKTPARRTIYTTKLNDVQLLELMEITGENFNRLMNRLINEEHIRRTQSKK